ncbi:MAG TPA: carboxypeptidase-like regulatory domain-containing protein [Terriglobales bacterium]
MIRKLGCVLVVLTLAATASAAVNPGAISGYVRNSSGTPQMGATVEVLSASNIIQVQTDAKGFYSLKGLLPGLYAVRVSAPSFLPSIREKVNLQSGVSLIINVTLNTLFEAIQLLPKRSNSPEDEDDWKWTLRSVANRPVLRLADDGPLVVVSQSDNEDDRVLKAKVSFMAGTDGEAYSTPDMATNFEIEQSIFSGGKLGFDGSVTTGTTTPSAIFRASYKHRMDNGSEPEIAITARRFATPELASGRSSLQALAMQVSDSMAIGDFLELNYGSELQTIQFLGTATAFRPFGSADLHLGKNTIVEYRYQSSVPNMRYAKGFESAPLDLSESGPRVSLTNSRQTIERAHHNEVSLTRRLGANTLEVAYYRDLIENPVITGIADQYWGVGDVLPDIYGGTFNYNGGELDTSGLRFVYQRKLTDRISATLDYATGGVLTLPEDILALKDARGMMRTERRHAFAAKVSGTVPGSNTRWITSYRWTSGDALTPVDIFNLSPGQTDPFLNVFVRQPIPSRRFIPAGMEALIDVRNLLAQGYRPVVGSDGQTVYLVQTARSIRGGVSFTF